MQFHLWVVAYTDTSGFPSERGDRYRAFQGQPVRGEEGACRHWVEARDLHFGKVAAIIEHERGEGCGACQTAL